MPPSESSGDPSPLNALLGGAARRFGLDDALASGALWKRWSELVGPAVAAHAQPTSLRGGVLRIRADSPVWAHEIGYLADEIKRKANAALGTTAVAEVRVWSGPGETAPTPPPASGSRPGADGAPPAKTEDAEDDLGAAGEDPLEALEKARKAWLERRARGRA